MGDFNTNIDRYHDKVQFCNKLNWKYNLLHYIFRKNFVDLFDISNDTTKPTWHGPNDTSSRIDGIFASSNFIADFLYCGTQAPLIYSSDHQIVIATL